MDRTLLREYRNVSPPQGLVNPPLYFFPLPLPPFSLTFAWILPRVGKYSVPLLGCRRPKLDFGPRRKGRLSSLLFFFFFADLSRVVLGYDPEWGPPDRSGG